MTSQVDSSLVFLNTRSYSTLSVGSTRSSVTTDFQDIPKAPSIISNSELPVSSELLVSEEHGETASPAEPVPPVVIKVENSTNGTHVNPTLDVHTGEEIAVEEVVDEEFGSFVAVSNVTADPKELPNQSVVPPMETVSSEYSELVEKRNNIAVVTQTAPQGDDHHSPEVVRSNDVTVVPQEHSLASTPEQRNRTGHSVEKNQTPPQRHSKPANQTDKLALKKNRTGKKVGKKESQRKKRPKSKAEVIDDNQSEISYQPDTDLSRSKASKKINGK